MDLCEMTGQPIETAPKDGTRILLWVAPDDADPTHLTDKPRWVFASWVTWPQNAKAKGFEDGWNWHGPGMGRMHATHWQPEPEPVNTPREPAE